MFRVSNEGKYFRKVFRLGKGMSGLIYVLNILFFAIVSDSLTQFTIT